MTYQTINLCDRNSPAYFSNVHLKQAKRCTRLTGPLLESSYKPKLATVGYRSFDAFAPPLWNSLPLDIRIISNIKTFKKD